LEIVGGKFYYDSRNNAIVVPLYYMDPDTNQKVSIWQLNAALYDDPNIAFKLQTLPGELRVDYFSGNGLSVTVPVEACGTGPSYQLDRECVCFIANHSNDVEASNLPPFVQSDSGTLPDMGTSEAITTFGPDGKANGSQAHPLKWLVYNHDPIIGGTNVGWLVGDELGPSKWSDSDILSLLTGGHAGMTSNLGHGAVLGGKATGEVTLYGLPNTILSGSLACYAKAYTERSYHLPEGTVTMAERTGGYKSGAFVFRLEIASPVNNGERKSVSAGVPTVLIYLRERSLDKSQEHAPLR